MSFALTTPQMYAREKTVTRRSVRTWLTLEPGDRLLAVEKGRGLAKGERQVRIGEIEIISVRVEPLDAITAEDCAREGFPHFTPEDFVTFYLEKLPKRRRDPGAPVRRIEFRHVESIEPTIAHRSRALRRAVGPHR